MKRLTSALLTLTFALSLPVAAAAMSHEKHEMEHGDMHHDAEKMHKGHGEAMEHAKEKAHGMHEGHGEAMEHGMEKAHEMHEGHGSMQDMQVIGEDVEDGVKGTAKIMAYSEEHAAMVNATHHLMVEFVDTATSQPVTAGTVAVKIEGHGKEKGKPVKLMQMDQGFGADLRLDPGHYEIEVGTKLADGEKRKFEYEYMVK